MILIDIYLDSSKYIFNKDGSRYFINKVELKKSNLKIKDDAIHITVDIFVSKKIAFDLLRFDLKVEGDFNDKINNFWSKYIHLI